MIYLRHDSGDKGLEAQTKEGQERRDPTTNRYAHGRESTEERQDSEKQGDDHEGEHEPRHQEVVVGTGMVRSSFPIPQEEAVDLLNESRRNIDSSVEVPVTRGVEGKVGIVFTAVTLTIRGDCTEVPKRPSRRCWSARDGTGIGFQEVDDVGWVRIPHTSQEGQPHQEEARGHKEPAPKAPKRSYSEKSSVCFERNVSGREAVLPSMVWVVQQDLVGCIETNEKTPTGSTDAFNIQLQITKQLCR